MEMMRIFMWMEVWILDRWGYEEFVWKTQDHGQRRGYWTNFRRNGFHTENRQTRLRLARQPVPCRLSAHQPLYLLKAPLWHYPEAWRSDWLVFVTGGTYQAAGMPKGRPR